MSSLSPRGPSSPPPLLQLPPECALQVLKHLPVRDVVATAVSCKSLRALVADDALWAELAEAKWGIAVRELKPMADADADERQRASGGGTPSSSPTAGADGAAPLGSWQAYCYKRMSARSIEPSPRRLGQEKYPDPWQHIISCVLCCRTSGGATVHDAITSFFEVLPTPTAVLNAPEPLLLELLHPLGLQANRMAAVQSVSRNFLATDWNTPAEFKGCGKFVTDSWRIFCKGCRDSSGVADTNLRQYLAWVNRQAGQQQEGEEQKQPLKRQPRSKQRLEGPAQGRSGEQAQAHASVRLTRSAAAGKQQQQQPAPTGRAATKQTRARAAAAAGAGVGGGAAAAPGDRTAAAAAAAGGVAARKAVAGGCTAAAIAAEGPVSRGPAREAKRQRRAA